jgi:hypothetical protein
MIARPSRAISADQSDSSSPFRSREDIPIAAVPDKAALIPDEDPPPWISILISGCIFMYSSARISAKGWTDVDPAMMI